MKLNRDIKFGEESTCCLKIGIRNLTNFDTSTLSKMFTLMGSFWAKYILLELKKYAGVIFYETEEGYKNWRKTDLMIGKWHEEFGKFSPEHSKVSKLELWWDPFVQSRKCMSLKLTEELCVMTRMIQKLKRNWLVLLKLTWGSAQIWPEHLKVWKICVLIGSL